MSNEQSSMHESHDEHEGEQVHQLQLEELSTGIVGLFEAPDQANQAFEALLRLGHHPDEIGIMIAEATKGRFVVPSPLTHPIDASDKEHATQEQDAHVDDLERRAVLKGAGAVSAVGALGGIVIGATASVLVPGFGLWLIGPLAGLGAAFGAYVGGVYAVPAIEAAQGTHVTRYEREVRAGKVLIHVVPRSPEDEVRIREEWARIEGGADEPRGPSHRETRHG
ncbi:MAG TPA: hypothetical protein VM509_08490 [Planctomycetota bacterium]|nr:hypothetical protein [Planctomycetota bacterium]